MQSVPDDPISSEIAGLQQPLKGRRLFSWLFLIIFLLAFLVAPVLATIYPAQFDSVVAGNYFKPNAAAVQSAAIAGTTAAVIDTKTGKAMSAHPTYMQLDSSWNPGHLSSSHQPWANDCKVCHTKPFERVQDKDCVACHAATGEHVSLKTAKVEGLHEVRCATCHRDHQGEFGLTEQNKRYTGTNCAACHTDIKASFPKSQAENVKDFATDHPDFRIQVDIGAGPDLLARMRRTAHKKLTEPTNLKFPHDVHLTAGGVRSPKGKVKMACDTCHKPNSDGSTFQPVTMKDNCQSCHALKFEPAVSNREVPHGSVSQVLTTLREFYSYVSTNKVPLDRRAEDGPIFNIRPGKEDAMSSFVRTPGDARNRAAAAATELFEKTSCITCHEVTRKKGPGEKGTPGQDMPQWSIAPMTPQHAWMPKAHFSHVRHQSAKCADCHDSAKSKEASDVSMPAIAQCQDCHAGKKPVVNKVTSDCGLCHGFHMPSTVSADMPGGAHMTPAHASALAPASTPASPAAVKP
jgi:hypothetical protein